MKRSILTVILLTIWMGVANARPLLIDWRYQQGRVAATRIVLFRSEDNRPMYIYAIIGNVTRTFYLDRQVNFRRKYCYQLIAETAMGKRSLPSATVCAKPNK